MPYRTIEMFALGPLHVRTWGLMVALGVFAGTALAARLADRRGLPGDRLWTVALAVAGAGILGSRVLWALQPGTIGETLADPLRLVAVWKGGLTLIGGVLAAVPAGILVARRVGLPLRATVDVVAPGFGLGIAIGRVGCYLTGLHPGRPTSLPWGIDYLGAVRHPIPLYESVLGLGLLALGFLLLRRRLPGGAVGLSITLAYFVGRSLLDLLRAESVAGADPRLIGSLTLTQGITLVAVPLLIGALVVVLRGRTPDTMRPAVGGS
ncbi:MAG: prolipoprotein diacylglyceryl transferase [Thermoleophilia bacterium]|nr:prolipoprotein diacylglyceryl transferase [Thermoleophilia bacterium]